jgi:beta-glucosidase
VIAMNGSPINLSWAKDNAAAILEAWYPGQSGGLAVGNVLSGKTNPSRRLPLTFYRSVDELPPFGDYDDGRADLSLFHGHAGLSVRLWPQLHPFAYAPLEVDAGSAVGPRKGIRVTTEGAQHRRTRGRREWPSST